MIKYLVSLCVNGSNKFRAAGFVAADSLASAGQQLGLFPSESGLAVRNHDGALVSVRLEELVSLGEVRPKERGSSPSLRWMKGDELMGVIDQFKSLVH